jgi:hypothetical protein
MMILDTLLIALPPLAALVAAALIVRSSARYRRAHRSPQKAYGDSGSGLSL